MAALSAGSIVANPHSGHYSFRLISPPMKFPPQAVIGGSSGPDAITAPSRPYFQLTAGVCFLVRLSSIRLCGSRGIIPLVGSGLKAQRNPFICFPIASSTLHTDAVKILELDQHKIGSIAVYLKKCHQNTCLSHRNPAGGRSTVPASVISPVVMSWYSLGSRVQAVWHSSEKLNRASSCSPWQ